MSNLGQWILYLMKHVMPQPDIYEKIEHIATFQLNDLHKRAFIKGRMGEMPPLGTMWIYFKL